MMYTRYFGFSDAPFSIAPDPRFLYLSAHHREALAHLLYGVEQGGFVVLTGEVGTGKTTVCRCLLQQLPKHVDVAFIINPKQTVTELLQSILAELGLDLGGDITSNKLLVDLLNERLLEGHAQGRNTILIVDEAQNLAPEVLEQLRLLTNLETSERKLLQLILLGQPELNDLLDSQQLRQLAQRVTARYHLSALAPLDVREYVLHRLAVAGFRGELFSRAALRQVAHRSRGIPRLINLICDRALLGVYAASGQQVDRRIVNRAADEVLPRSRFRARRWISAALLIAVSGLAGWMYLEQPSMPVAAGDATRHGTDTELHSGLYSGESAPLESSAFGADPAALPTLVSARESADIDTATPQPDSDDTGSALYIALHDMARLWQMDTPPSRCDGPLTPELWCVPFSGGLQLLQTMGIPAVLQLSEPRRLDPQGQHSQQHHSQQRYVVVEQFSDGQVSLRTGDATERVSIPELERLWQGSAWIITPLDPELAQQLPLQEGATLSGALAQAIVRLPHLTGEQHYPGYRQSVLYERHPPPGLAGAVFEQLQVITRDGPAQQVTPAVTELLRSFQSQQGLATSGELDALTALHLLASTHAGPALLSGSF